MSEVNVAEDGLPGGKDFVCPFCGAQGLDSWRFDHCWKCGDRASGNAVKENNAAIAAAAAEAELQGHSTMTAPSDQDAEAMRQKMADQGFRGFGGNA